MHSSKIDDAADSPLFEIECQEESTRFAGTSISGSISLMLFRLLIFIPIPSILSLLLLRSSLTHVHVRGYGETITERASHSPKQDWIFFNFWSLFREHLSMICSNCFLQASSCLVYHCLPWSRRLSFSRGLHGLNSYFSPHALWFGLSLGAMSMCSGFVSQPRRKSTFLEKFAGFKSWTLFLDWRRSPTPLDLLGVSRFQEPSCRRCRIGLKFRCLAQLLSVFGTYRIDIEAGDAEASGAFGAGSDATGEKAVSTISGDLAFAMQFRHSKKVCRQILSCSYECVL